MWHAINAAFFSEINSNIFFMFLLQSPSVASWHPTGTIFFVGSVRGEIQVCRLYHIDHMEVSIKFDAVKSR